MVLLDGESKNKINELLEEIEKGLFTFIKVAMYHPDSFTLDDHLNQKTASAAMEELKKIIGQ